MKHAPLAALAVLALLAAACGGGSQPAQKPAPAPAKTTAAQPAAKPAAAATPQTAPSTVDKAVAMADSGGELSQAAVQQANQIFQARCTPCHGASGHGDGAAAAALNPKPRDYSDKAWQASITDEKIAQAIVGGGTSVGLSALMPPNPDLKDKPEVVAALVAKIRSFAK